MDTVKRPAAVLEGCTTCTVVDAYLLVMEVSAERRRFEALLEAAPDAIFLADREGRWIEFDRVAISKQRFDDLDESLLEGIAGHGWLDCGRKKRWPGGHLYRRAI